jgi:diaminohydroxyphosphoribosylaminopyrimidine deaminase/5-amino-6-(5-phosphoribosylamino)uracil reductase
MMRRAIALGLRNLGKTWPNPSVGCVLARDGSVLAEAVTGEGGRPHAEEQALAAAGDAARGCTAYVTLEPCGARSSGAAPCAERLAAAGCARVVIACEDPSPFASGQGIERLRAAGLRIETGLLADEAAILCEGFVRRLASGRPLVRESDGGEGFDAPFDPGADDPAAALDRLGAQGYTRLWVQAGGPLAKKLRETGFLD